MNRVFDKDRSAFRWISSDGHMALVPCIAWNSPFLPAEGAQTQNPVLFVLNPLDPIHPQVGNGTGTFERASSATVKQSSHVWVEVGSHIHRVWNGTYDNGWSAPGITTTTHYNVTWYNQDGFGLLLEPSRTNHVTWGRDLTQSYWSKSDVSVTFDQVGIEGVVNSASKATDTNTAAFGLLYQQTNRPQDHSVAWSVFNKIDATAGGWVHQIGGDDNPDRACVDSYPVEGTYNAATAQTGSPSDWGGDAGCGPAIVIGAV
ncbi:MAG: hypothetical protein HQL63_06650, partial [Magnetococcales bacterium]|nr:hypothetical protein [Magnetococcales bacterium]